jgi:hypothetical protein
MHLETVKVVLIHLVIDAIAQADTDTSSNILNPKKIQTALREP